MAELAFRAKSPLEPGRQESLLDLTIIKGNMVTVLYDLGESSGDISMPKLSSGKKKTLRTDCCACYQNVKHNIGQSEV